MSVTKLEALEIVCRCNKLMDKFYISSLLRTEFPSSFSENDIGILYSSNGSGGFKNLITELINFDIKNDNNINLNFIRFKSDMVFDVLNNKTKDISFKYSIFYGDVLFSGYESGSKLIFHYTKCNNLRFENFTFNKPIEFHYCTFNGSVHFQNVMCKEYASFKFNVYKEVCDFSSMEFQNRVVFLNNDCLQGIDIMTCVFNETFSPLFVFNNVENPKSLVVNRESATKIKHFIEIKGDLIGSNKWYAIEMEKYEEDLKDKKNNLFDLLVMKVHKYTSNYSQDFVLVFLWICFLIATNFIFLSEKIYEVNILIVSALIIVYLIISFFFDTITSMSNAKYSLYAIIFPLTFTAILLTVIILIFGSDGTCNYRIFKKSINIFNIIFTLESSNPAVMFYSVISKAIMIFLSYQFVISVRQNTRRK